MAGLAEGFIRKAKFVVDQGEYAILHLRDDVRPDLSDALVWLHASQDHTLVVPSAAAARYEKTGDVQGRDDGWKLITIEIDVPLTVFGFFRPFADALAEDEVPIVPFAGYRFDHMLVHKTNLDRALGSLRRVQAGLKKSKK
ncbi:MAG: ACT domain-containing protein [Euryarchaeota archaeon]|nr:ACT domain-containing protein [Euryarchaeota archaeon]